MDWKNRLDNLSHFSFQGFWRYLKLSLQRKEVAITGGCNCCGKCCYRINLQTENGWVRSRYDFDSICCDYPEYKRFEIIGVDKQGFLEFSCSWTTADGMCSDHVNRLNICKDFPNKSMHFSGGTLPSGCGYKMSEVTPFDKMLDEELDRLDNGKKNSGV